MLIWIWGDIGVPYQTCTVKAYGSDKGPQNNTKYWSDKGSRGIPAERWRNKSKKDERWRKREQTKKKNNNKKKKKQKKKHNRSSVVFGIRVLLFSLFWVVLWILSIVSCLYYPLFFSPTPYPQKGTLHPFSPWKEGHLGTHYVMCLVCCCRCSSYYWFSSSLFWSSFLVLLLSVLLVLLTSLKLYSCSCCHFVTVIFLCCFLCWCLILAILLLVCSFRL